MSSSFECISNNIRPLTQFYMCKATKYFGPFKIGLYMEKLVDVGVKELNVVLVVTPEELEVLVVIVPAETAILLF